MIELTWNWVILTINKEISVTQFQIYIASNFLLHGTKWQEIHGLDIFSKFFDHEEVNWIEFKSDVSQWYLPTQLWGILFSPFPKGKRLIHRFTDSSPTFKLFHIVFHTKWIYLLPTYVDSDPINPTQGVLFTKIRSTVAWVHPMYRNPTHQILNRELLSDLPINEIVKKKNN